MQGENKNKALFLDRDGVINVDKGYVYRFEDLIWMEEIFAIIQLAMEKNYKVIVLTNQSGIAKKMYSVQDVNLLHQQMDAFLKAKKLVVTDWFYCAELDHPSRKPRPGMLLAARDKYNLDLENSFMIGDKVSDIFETDGLFIGPQTYLIRGNYKIDGVEKMARVKVFDNHHQVLLQLEKIL